MVWLYRYLYIADLSPVFFLPLLQGISCPFYHKVVQKLGGQAKLRGYGYHSAWDIEDLVSLGKKIRVLYMYLPKNECFFLLLELLKSFR